jgi:hypothetical protein
MVQVSVAEQVAWIRRTSVEMNMITKTIYSKLFGEYAEVLRFHSYLFI